MHTQALTSAVVCAALLGGFCIASPASAQVTYAPEPSAPLMAKEVSTRPPDLGLETIVYAAGGPLHFEVRQDALALTQTPEGVVTDTGRNELQNKVLWTGNSGLEPQKFALVTTATDERIEDGTGNAIWSQPIQPKLTLDFSQPGLVRLLDANGKELGSGPADNHVPQNTQFLGGRRFSRGYSTSEHGVRIEADVFDQRMAVYDGKYLLWSGPRPSNDGIQLGSTPGSRVLGITTSQYRAGTVISFTVTKEAGSMEIADKNHQLLETVPADTLRLTVLNNDPAFRKDARNFWLLQPHAALTQADPLAPGQLYVTYHAANGAWIAGELVRADKVTGRFRQLPMSRLRQLPMSIALNQQDTLEIKASSLDEAGNPENSPHIEYGWSRPL